MSEYFYFEICVSTKSSKIFTPLNHGFSLFGAYRLTGAGCFGRHFLKKKCEFIKFENYDNLIPELYF